MRKSNFAVAAMFICLGFSAARAWDWSKPFIYEMRIAFETDNWINMYSTATVLSKSDNTVAFRVVANSTVTPTYQLVVTTQGNVGIGTDAPSEKLYITQSASGQYLKMVLDNGNSAADSGRAFSAYDAMAYGGVITQLGAFGTNYNNSLFTGFGYLGSSKLSLVANGNNSGIIKFMTVSGGNYCERMRISNDGYVGIGTVNPQYPLDVRYDGDNAVGSFINGSNTAGASYGIFLRGGTDSTDYAFYAMNHAGNQHFIIRGNGNVGIGTTEPGGYRLRVAGGSAAVDTGQSWTTTSDIRLKKDVADLGPTLAGVLALRGVRYHAKDEKNSDGLHIGFIAQEFEKYFPEVVITGSDGYKGIDYGRITAILLEAAKEQQRQIEQLRAENKARQDDIKALMAELESLKSRR